MELPPQKKPLTLAQQQAITASGNVLVMAGAGTGKTHTLVERCLHCLCEENPRASLDEILIFTFTEAAAAEMRRRLRRALAQKLRQNPDDTHCAGQLVLFDTAHIGTLHSFCFKLVREHFYELGLDPQLSVLDEGGARLLAAETLDEELQLHYAGTSELNNAVQNLIQIYGAGRDEKIRQLVLRLHQYSQTRPDAENWLTQQIEKFSAPTPDEWQRWLLEGIQNWRTESLALLASLRAENLKAAECLEILGQLPEEFTRAQATAILEKIQAADDNYPSRKKTVLREPLKKIFADAEFLNSLAPVENNHDPLVEDWNWVRAPMGALLQLTRNFSTRFAARKRDDGALDFHDLEQFALKLLWDFTANQPTPVARHWREKIRFVFVDEYQDINAAQDKIIQALSRDGADANRFLVGDVKQSIYRFRLADPKIFRAYARDWRNEQGRTIPLTENFRSRESLLDFVNSLFALLMREEVGGVLYDDEARLQFGLPESRVEFSSVKNLPPRAELLLHLEQQRDENSSADESDGDEPVNLETAEKDARLLAFRLKKLQADRHEIWDDEEKKFRAVEWRDMAVLLRSPAGKSEIFAKQFEHAGVPLVIARGGFYDQSEILDLLSLLQLLDNPLQDVPAIAVLRSPLVGLSLDELAQIRLAAPGHFWFALNQACDPKSKIEPETRAKIEKFLERFTRWRKLARQASLSRCLEEVLSETHYADWLQALPRGAQRYANVERLLHLAQKFDQFQRQGLFRFLKFIETQCEADVEPEMAAVATENAVRLMSIHQSKGLEFPVVAVADLAKPFNLQDLRGEIIFDEEFGLCPRVKPPLSGRRYPSLPHWLAQQRQRREQAGEELRLLYVALTRARDTLILAGSISEKNWETLWTKPETATASKIASAKSYADWLGLWFAQQNDSGGTMEGELSVLRWKINDDTELSGVSAEEKSDAESNPLTLDDSTKEKLHAVLTWQYEFGAATRRAAKSSVTTLRQQAEKETVDEAEQLFPVRRGRHTKLSAVDTGTAHHKFLQHVSLERVGELAALEVEAGRLEQEKILSSDERRALILANVVAFWNSAAGKKIREQPASVKRELAFTAKFTPAELDGIFNREPAAKLEYEFVVVQGVADLVVLQPREIWLADFKTDDVRASDLPAKTEFYAPQLKLYARAFAKIYSRPVTRCWLHFLAARQTVNVEV
jgi:ATP-dependent helicase/nuclease subunit A